MTTTTEPAAVDEWCKCGYRRSAHTEQPGRADALCPIQEYKSTTGRSVVTPDNDRFFRRSAGFNA